jgi:hypothetical protein
MSAHFTHTNQALQGTAQQRYRRRNRERLLYARRGYRLVVLKGTTGQPVGWLVQWHENGRKGTRS